jgi:hypothetical protein
MNMAAPAWIHNFRAGAAISTAVVVALAYIGSQYTTFHTAGWKCPV